MTMDSVSHNVLLKKGNVPGAKEFSCQQILWGIDMTFHYIKALNRLQEAAYKQIAESMEYLLLLTAEGTCLFIIDSKKK